MDKRTYEATSRKLRSAHEALEAASRTAEYGERIAIVKAQEALKNAAEALRVQACKECDKNGFRETPGHPGWQQPCTHPTLVRHLPEPCMH